MALIQQAAMKCTGMNAFSALLYIHYLSSIFQSLMWHRRTPLIAAVVSNIANFGLDMLFMFVFGWGVAGAALATSASQYISAAIMLMLQVRNGMLQLHHVLERPLWHDWAPLIKVWLHYYCCWFM